MSWFSEGKLVYKGTKANPGEQVGALDSDEKAQAYLRALYANSETSTIKKAEGDIWALFPLGAQAELVAAQENIASQVSDFEPVDPATFHITAVYTNGVDVLGLDQWFEYSWWNAFAVIVDGIDSFETPEGYAVYLRVRYDYVLNDLQRAIFDALTYHKEGFVSNYSVPSNWIAHITMGYSQSPVGSLEFNPFAVICTRIEIGDENHMPLMQVELKADSEEVPVLTKFIQKSTPIEIISKSVHFTDEGDLVIPVIGFPFNKPDIDGDWYHKGTDTGPLTELIASFDHERMSKYLPRELKALGMTTDEIKSLGPDFGFGTRDIGIARKAETTEDGIIFNVIVNRNVKYKNALAKAAREGYLGGSSEAKAYEYDPTIPGKVDYASAIGMALTPSPKNIEAAVLKSAQLEGDMPTKAKAEKKDEKEVVEGEAEKEAVEVPAKTSIKDAIKAKAAEIKAESEVEAEETETDEPINVAERLTALETKFDGVLKAIETFHDEMTDALPELAVMIADALEGSVQEMVRKSRLELNIPAKTTQRVEKSAPPNRATQQPPPLHNRSGATANWPGRE